MSNLNPTQLEALIKGALQTETERRVEINKIKDELIKFNKTDDLNSQKRYGELLDQFAALEFVDGYYAGKSDE